MKAKKNIYISIPKENYILSSRQNESTHNTQQKTVPPQKMQAAPIGLNLWEEKNGRHVSSYTKSRRKKIKFIFIKVIVN